VSVAWHETTAIEGELIKGQLTSEMTVISKLQISIHCVPAWYWCS